MKIYGVYGKNGGGVYTNWQKVLESRRYIDGIKNKAFKSRIEAIAFIIKGLEQDYGVVGEGELSREILEKRNWFYRLVDFEK